MGSIVFVHGTGVRKEAYAENCAQLTKRLAKHAPGWNLIECLWGDHYGVRLHLQGRSIPDYACVAAGQSSDELMQ